MTSLQYTTNDGVYTIEITQDIDTFQDTVDYLIKPCFIAAGYQPETLEEYFGNE